MDHHEKINKAFVDLRYFDVSNTHTNAFSIDFYRIFIP